MATRKTSARSTGTTRKTTAARKTSATGSARKTAKGAATKKATARKAATPRAASKKAASTKTAAKKVVAKKAAGKTVAKKAAAKRVASPKATARKAPAKKAAARRTPKVSAEQALANTRQLLEAKQAKRRETPPWQALGEAGGQGNAPHAGFQSDEARVQATTLHNDEVDLPAVQGHVSDLNRQKQGRRDHRTQNRH